MCSAVERADELRRLDSDARLFVHLPHGGLLKCLPGLDFTADGEPVGRRRPGWIVTEQEQHSAIAVDW